MMIMTKTPFRISFIGGGSDFKEFYQSEPGAVVSTAIDKYMYIIVNRRFDSEIRVGYSKTEIVASPEQLEHELARESLKMLDICKHIEIVSVADIPKGTGLGSSSSYTVGLLNALYAFKGQPSYVEHLAQRACEIEIERCQKPIGKQDQYIAAYGGLRYIQFHPDESVSVEPLELHTGYYAKLRQHLLLLYTGITRQSETILATQQRKIKHKRLSLRRLVELAREFKEAIEREQITELGLIVHEGWMIKRQLSHNITNASIDKWYETALECGAIGGKLLGAGGGGFLLLFASPQVHPKIVNALPELTPVPFNFERNGSIITHMPKVYS